MAETIYIVQLSGYGYKNGNVSINKTLEFENISEYQKFQGSNKLEEISRVISFHYPNVEFDPKKITINTNSRKKSKSKKTTKTATAVAGAFVAGRLSKGKTEKKENATETSFANELRYLQNISFGNDIEDITNKLDELYFGIKNYKWKYSNDDKNKKIVQQNNQALTKCLNKFKQGLIKLYKRTNDENIRKEYNTKFKKLNRKKGLDKFGLIILGVICFFIIMLFLWLKEK